MTRAREWALAALLAFHVLAITLPALPAPQGAMNDVTFQAESTQQLFRDAHGVLSSFGFEGDVADVEAIAWDGGIAWMDARRTALAPFQPYYEHAGTTQGWQMFTLVNRKPGRMELSVDGELVYRTNDRDHTWQIDLLEASRMRGLQAQFGWAMSKKRWGELFTFLAERAAVDFPDASRFEGCIRFTRLPEPGGEMPEGVCRWKREAVL